MSNPYLSRGPVRDPAMLFGRSHELNEIAAFIRGSQSVSIIGPRKIGKTSLLFQLMRRAAWPQLGLGEDNLFVYLDCEALGAGAHAEVFGQFAAEMIVALDERGLPAEPALEAAAMKPTRLSFEAAVRKLNRRGLRVVLILDEFERLSTNAQLNVNFFNALRSAAGRYQLVFLTGSAHQLIDLTYAERAQEILSSPFFNIFAPLFLGLLLEDDARQLIGEPSRRAKVTFSSTTEDYLYTLAGGHPLVLQVACFHAFEAGDDHAEIERRAVRELEAHFAYTWHNLTADEQYILCRVDDVANRASGDTNQRGLLRDLVQKSLLVVEGGVYRYPFRAWAQFVAAQNGMPNPLETIVMKQARSQEAVHAPTPPRPNSGAGSLTGSRLGAYDVLEPLGQGGMAEVYRGRHTRLDRVVAIKVLPAELADHVDFRERFEREARAVAALSHPNIVQVYDFGDANGIYYMVMEYIPGADLARYLREHGPLPLAEVQLLARDVAAALDYAHAQGLVHRDVKPANVLLQLAALSDALEQRAILTDFGIAKILTDGASVTGVGMMLGTLDYMAPEQIRAAAEVDGRADVYALGVMLFQMLTGRLPFTGDNPGAVVLAHLQQAAPDMRRFVPTLPATVAAAIARALAKDPAERPATAGALVDTLGADSEWN